MYVASIHAALARPVEPVRYHVPCLGTLLQLTSRICVAPKHHGPVVAVLRPQHLMQLHCKAVQVSDVQWTKVGMESIVQQAAVNGEVYRRRSALHRLRPLLCSC